MSYSVFARVTIPGVAADRVDEIAAAVATTFGEGTAFDAWHDGSDVVLAGEINHASGWPLEQTGKAIAWRLPPDIRLLRFESWDTDDDSHLYAAWRRGTPLDAPDESWIKPARTPDGQVVEGSWATARTLFVEVFIDPETSEDVSLEPLAAGLATLPCFDRPPMPHRVSGTRDLSGFANLPEGMAFDAFAATTLGRIRELVGADVPASVRAWDEKRPKLRQRFDEERWPIVRPGVPIQFGDNGSSASLRDAEDTRFMDATELAEWRGDDKPDYVRLRLANQATGGGRWCGFCAAPVPGRRDAELFDVGVRDYICDECRETLTKRLAPGAGLVWTDGNPIGKLPFPPVCLGCGISPEDARVVTCGEQDFSLCAACITG